MSGLVPINPDSLARPRGYSHGMRGQGELVFVAGQIGWNREGRMVSADLVEQFAQALDNVLDVVWRAGGRPESVARMVLYVTDKGEYRRRAKPLGEAWRRRMGRHYPAMVLVEVKSLLEDDAKVEIEATALV
ncbi:MAG TPA: RidA family protein [Vicinamibacteria bacterium]|nr:RidA family protein [Vicinamibacteria bacterium]